MFGARGHNCLSPKSERAATGLSTALKQIGKINLRDKLLATENRHLYENSPYDYYWGIGKEHTGKNRLGELLMQVRDELQQSKGSDR